MNDHHEQHCKCSKCKGSKYKFKGSKHHKPEKSKDFKYFKHKDRHFHDFEESKDNYHKEDKDFHFHDYEESKNHYGKKHRDHHFYDFEESRDSHPKKHKDFRFHDLEESKENHPKKHSGYHFDDFEENKDYKYKKHMESKYYDFEESQEWEGNKYGESNSCVCDKVREINAAQHKVSRKKHGCDVSCEKSIKELLNKCKPSEFDTIPFKLLCGCKGTCEDFVGTGVVKINGCFFDIRSSFFRVVDFVKDSSCCVILELLCPDRCEGTHGIEGFVRTGACFEVDLNDFTGITCFPPVAAKKMDPSKLLNGGSYKKKSR